VTIKAFLGYLEDDINGIDRERIGTDMHYIRSAADKMGRLLEELLEMSRIGRVTSVPVRVAFRELVDEALDIVAGSIAGRWVDVRVGDHDIILHGDRPRLVEIWQNLVENACKFMGGQSAPRIEVGVEQRGKDAVFFVRDNGIGVEPLFKDKVFGLFEKLDPKSAGTGLGLALVKRIVELYRGDIWVESHGSGQGACFKFTLPDAVTERAQRPGASEPS
jgi:signal transduction histidine kinase